MRRSSRVLAVALVVLFPTAALAETLSVDRLRWLAGVWSGTTNGVRMEEHWSTPDGGGLIGMHKDSKGALHARIEGTIDGKERSEEWVWTKAKAR